jgi:hypothetical protein
MHECAILATKLSTILVDILVDQHVVATVHRGVSWIANRLVSGWFSPNEAERGVDPSQPALHHPG